jgi:protein gp37
MHSHWAIDIRNQCVAAKVPFFFKQWGGRSPKSGGRLLDGKEWNQFPATLHGSTGQYELQARA